MSTIDDQVRRDAGTMRKLRQLCGYVENGSDTIVKIFQDDATRSWHVSIGGGVPSKHTYWGASIDEACDKAIADGHGAD